MRQLSRQIAERIRLFNVGRSPDTLAVKYRKLRADAFAFLRGTCHLFYQDWPGSAALNAAPLAWLCGDLHLENFGAYKADDRSVHFNVNDFDEAALAPATWDLSRCLTSLFVALATLELGRDDAQDLAKRLLDRYVEALTRGKTHQVELDHATGPVKDLLRGLCGRLRAAYLDEHTRAGPGGRRFKTDGARLLPVTEADRQAVTLLIQAHGQRQDRAGFFQVVDVARRVAGNSSLGLKRYAVLVEGKGSPDGNRVLDLKEERVSALHLYLTVPQPGWRNQAERVITAQRYAQELPPALLASLELGAEAYVLRELQLGQDRIDLAGLAGHRHDFADVITTLAQVVAWGQLRSAGRGGSAQVDELVAFGQDAGWRDEVMRYSRYYAAQAAADYLEYAGAYDQDELNLAPAA